MAFFVAIILLYRFDSGWPWYAAAVACQFAHWAFLDYRFRELDEKIMTTRMMILDALRGRL